MNSTGRRGLAIVDEGNHLVGHISGKDPKLFLDSHCSYEILKLPIIHFLSQLRSEDIVDIRAPSISCNVNETIGHLIKKLAVTGIHRIYIVPSSQDYTPIRVISLTDIIAFILHQNR